MSCLIVARDINLEGRFHQLTLCTAASGLVCLLGANGAGKSSLLEVLAGLSEPTKGSVTWDGQNVASFSLAELAAKRGYLAQQTSLQFELTGSDCLRFSSHWQEAMIPELLVEQLQLASLLDKPCTRLSGGELQRLLVARSLLQVWHPIMTGRGLLILDEPLQGLDVRHQLSLMQWLTELSTRGNQIILSCHDVNIAYAFADTVWLARSGEIVANGPVDDVMTVNNLRQTFDCHFDFLAHKPRGVFVLDSV